MQVLDERPAAGVSPVAAAQALIEEARADPPAAVVHRDRARRDCSRCSRRFDCDSGRPQTTCGAKSHSAIPVHRHRSDAQPFFKRSLRVARRCERTTRSLGRSRRIAPAISK